MQTDPELLMPPQMIDWYFLPVDAPWCGVPNVLNSRNWYLGTIGWPDLGEVEGAARPWRNGSVPP